MTNPANAAGPTLGVDRAQRTRYASSRIVCRTACKAQPGIAASLKARLEGLPGRIAIAGHNGCVGPALDTLPGLQHRAACCDRRVFRQACEADDVRGQTKRRNKFAQRA